MASSHASFEPVNCHAYMALNEVGCLLVKGPQKCAVLPVTAM